MTGARKPPLLREGALTGRVYVITSYTAHEDGTVVARVKHDVTAQFEDIEARRAFERDKTVITMEGEQ